MVEAQNLETGGKGREACINRDLDVSQWPALRIDIRIALSYGAFTTLENLAS